MPYSELDPLTANTRLAEFRIVDVREAHEFAGPLGKIAGAELVALGTVRARADELRGSRPLLLVCRSGARSGKACELLQQHGMIDVTNLVGGMIAWNRAALPVQREQLESLDALLKSLAAWLAQISGNELEEAIADLDHRLQEAGASLAAPSAEATAKTLDAIATRLDDKGPPPDLDLTLAAFRRDLAEL
jgi:rhodanese-related sulfurtransferase